MKIRVYQLAYNRGWWIVGGQSGMPVAYAKEIYWSEKKALNDLPRVESELKSNLEGHLDNIIRLLEANRE